MNLPLKRPGVQPWQRNLWAIVVAEVMALLSFRASFVLIPYYLQDLGVRDVAQVAAWTGAIGFAIATPLWGALGDRHGLKPMLLRAMFATSLVLAGIGIVRTPTQLMALRVVQGFFTGTPTTVFYVAGVSFALVTMVNVAVGARPAQPSGGLEEAPAPQPAAATAPQRDRA